MLRNVPSVEVDNDGNVSLRGSSNVKILIDGKPSALLSNGTQVLQNIPASMIDKVEVINNPSAKYEAEGVSGIINIIMKPSNEFGYNGNVKVNGGTEDKYNFSTGGSVKKINGPLREITVTGITASRDAQAFSGKYLTQAASLTSIQACPGITRVSRITALSERITT